VLMIPVTDQERDASARSSAAPTDAATPARAPVPLAQQLAPASAATEAAKPTTRPEAPETRLPAPALPASVVPASAIPASPGSAAAPPLATRLPPVIVGVALPRTIVPGKPFVATIVYRAGDDLQVSVERRVVAGALGAGPVVTLTPASELTSPKGGALSYPVDALKPASRATVEFTLIDRNGLRSEPKRVQFETAAVADDQPSVACTRASCGSVVAVREVGGATGADAGKRIANAIGKLLGKTREAGPARYEVIVRMDDRSIHTVTQSGKPKVGTRVRLAGAKAVPLTARASSSGAAALPEGRLLPESAPITSP
jgi:hypothetical protein